MWIWSEDMCNTGLGFYIIQIALAAVDIYLINEAFPAKKMW